MLSFVRSILDSIAQQLYERQTDTFDMKIFLFLSADREEMHVEFTEDFHQAILSHDAVVLACETPRFVRRKHRPTGAEGLFRRRGGILVLTL
jgi:hypothetical protein